MEIERVLEYWFGDIQAPDDVDEGCKKKWWMGGEAVDREIKEQFSGLVERACAGELDGWASTPRGALALVVILDQFTRNIGRGSAQAFRGDAKALEVCMALVEAGTDRSLRLVERQFLYMPAMHAEDRDVAKRSLELFDNLMVDIQASPKGDKLGDMRKHAKMHADIVLQFGRYPHRNEVMGRETTPEEAAFLADGGPSFGQSAKK